MVPHHSLIIDFSVKVQTIQVGVEATIVPPGAFLTQGTVSSPTVIVTIFGGKWISSVIPKGISSGTFKNNDNNKSETIRQQQHRELYRPSFSYELLARCLIKRYAVQAK